DAAARATVVPGFGPMAAQGTPQGTPLGAVPPGGAPLADPGYLQAMAAYNAGGAPAVPVPMAPAARDQARAVVGLPAPKNSGVGVVLLILLCVVAATGGYFVVHYLTNR